MYIFISIWTYLNVYMNKLLFANWRNRKCILIWIEVVMKIHRSRFHTSIPDVAFWHKKLLLSVKCRTRKNYKLHGKAINHICVHAAAFWKVFSHVNVDLLRVSSSNKSRNHLEWWMDGVKSTWLRWLSFEWRWKTLELHLPWFFVSSIWFLESLMRILTLNSRLTKLCSGLQTQMRLPITYCHASIMSPAFHIASSSLELWNMTSSKRYRM